MSVPSVGRSGAHLFIGQLLYEATETAVIFVIFWTVVLIFYVLVSVSLNNSKYVDQDVVEWNNVTNDVQTIFVKKLSTLSIEIIIELLTLQFTVSILEGCGSACSL